MEPGGSGKQSNRSACTVSVDSGFRPPLWMRNPHVQSILVSLPWRRPRVQREAAPLLAACREHLLDCGDGVRLQCFVSRPAAVGLPEAGRVAVLLHGWEGSSDSLYILSLAQKLFALGFDVVRLNLRDHGATHHLNRELFHSCLLPEVVGATRCIQAMLPGRPLHLAGFSLGGNFMLRVAACATEAQLDIAKVVAVSPVLDPTETLNAIEHGLPIYHKYFIRKWSASLLKKQAAWPSDYDFGDLLKLASLRHMTAEMVARFTKFASLEEYLNGYAITGERLARLSAPTTVITAEDDPIIPVRGLQRLSKSVPIAVTVTRYGGHCGFFDHLSGPTWLERRILAELTQPVPAARDAAA
jgi:predicted alpha/beta-fold hydrolase